jgi:hypothetical protein
MGRRGLQDDAGLLRARRIARGRRTLLVRTESEVGFSAGYKRARIAFAHCLGGD